MKLHLRRRAGASRREPPLLGRSLWPAMPLWILLHPERGRARKCWNGCPLRRDKHDGRRYGSCQNRGCGVKPKAGAPVFGCRACGWAVCAECTRRPRMPTVQEDPLLHGPEDPCLLLSEELLSAAFRRELGDRLALTCDDAKLGIGRAGPPCGRTSEWHAGRAGGLNAGALPRGGYGTAIICPGGNYEFLSCLEGQPVVDWLASHGLTAVVLRYRLLPAFGLEEALDDLEDAVRVVRKLRPGPVVAIGFSAGGHLVASLAARCEERNPGAQQPLDGQVLVYPGIDGKSWDPAHTGEVCFFNHNTWKWPKRAGSLLHRQDALLGGNGFAAPPTLLVTSTADSCIPRSDVQPYVDAMVRAQVPHIHLRKNFGDHGFGLVGSWTTTCINWLRKQIGFRADGESLPQMPRHSQNGLFIGSGRCTTSINIEKRSRSCKSAIATTANCQRSIPPPKHGAMKSSRVAIKRIRARRLSAAIRTSDGTVASTTCASATTATKRLAHGQLPPRARAPHRPSPTPDAASSSSGAVWPSSSISGGVRDSPPYAPTSAVLPLGCPSSPARTAKLK